MKRIQITLVLLALIIGTIFSISSEFFATINDYLLAGGLNLISLGFIFSSYVFFKGENGGRTKSTNDFLGFLCVVLSFFTYFPSLIPLGKIVPREEGSLILVYYILVLVYVFWLNFGKDFPKTAKD